MTCHACEGLPPGTCALRDSLRGQLKPNYNKVQPVDNRMTDFVVDDLEKVNSLARSKGIKTDPTVDKVLWRTNLTKNIKLGIDQFPDCSTFFISYLRVLYFFRTIWDQA